MASFSGEPPSDHIFGDLDKPKNSAKWLLERNQGVHHYHQKTPANPKPGESVRLWVTSSADQPVESVHIWMTTDDWAHQTERLFSRHQLTWRTDLWSYLQEWEIMLAPQPAGTMLRYKIGAKLQGSETMLFADSQSESFQEATHFSIWFSDGQTPGWVDDAVVYQVFVDRFNPGKDNSWVETEDLRHQFGGTLQGVIEKLPYIRRMGFNALWLTPIFASPSHHGYDISDYYQINPRFGTLDNFLELVDGAHQHQIKVIFDFVANHCSNEHPFFQDALKNPDSQYHDYFVWKKWPRYECFYNVPTMPKLNLAYGSPARDYLLNCAQHWLELGVDGFRLDYAHGPEQDFWVDFRKACEAVKTDYWTFGEIVQPADVQATYAGGLMGSLDFLLSQAMRLTFGQLKWPLSKFAGFIQRHFAYFPEGFSLPAFIDNHDMNRFLVAANHDERLLMMALTVLYVLSWPPVIYYGTEAALSQHQSIHAKDAQGFDEARLPMPWENSESFTLPEFLAKLANVRKNDPEIRTTGWHFSMVDDQNEILVLEKRPMQNYLLLINRSENERALSLEINQPGPYKDVIRQNRYECVNNRLALFISPMTSMLLTTEGR
jgi:glycosidase